MVAVEVVGELAPRELAVQRQPAGRQVGQEAVQYGRRYGKGVGESAQGGRSRDELGKVRTEPGGGQMRRQSVGGGEGEAWGAWAGKVGWGVYV